ncbi:MAG: hypothetical protein NTW87_10785, partial [Planctomycetota bacterium]|nr:hypothetical protein [Planctomycetota bacterium]
AARSRIAAAAAARSRTATATAAGCSTAATGTRDAGAIVRSCAAGAARIEAGTGVEVEDGHFP